MSLIYVLAAVFTISVLLDAISTKYALSKGAVESNPFVGKEPSIPKMVVPLLMLVTTFGVITFLIHSLGITIFSETTLIVIWAISIAKLHAASENFLLGYWGQSPSSFLRGYLRIEKPISHIIFNAAYFGMPTVIILVFFLKDYLVAI